MVSAAAAAAGSAARAPDRAASMPSPVIFRPLPVSQRSERGLRHRCGRPARCATARASAASAIMAAASAGLGSPDSTRSSRCVPGVHSDTMYGPSMS